MNCSRLKPKVAVLGNISKDTIRSIDTSSYVGGAGANIALAMYQNNCDVTLFCNRSKTTKKFLQTYGDSINVTATSSPSCEIEFNLEYEEDGTLSSFESHYSTPEYRVQNLIPDDFNHVHICCCKPLRFSKAIEQVSKSGTNFSLNFYSSSIRQSASEVREHLKQASFLFLNRSEFIALKEIVDPSMLARAIVTDGSNPVSMYIFGELIQQVEIRQRKADNPTGAGDAFLGAFLSHVLQGAELIHSLKSASSYATSKLSSRGILGLPI
ncbi:MAG: carbohydrate kinase family protein [Kordiimonas sp.]